MKNTLNILIIEDNPDDFLLLEEVLKASVEVSFKIFHDERMAKAKITAKTHPIEVAAIDLSLPDSFGLETFTTFHEAFPNIPVVIITASRNHELALAAVKIGAQDYLFKGEPSATAIIRTLRYAVERQRLVSELKVALNQVNQLTGLLPICASCKKIRDDKGYWNRIEAYISEHSEAQFTHSLCPDCLEKLYSEMNIQPKDNGEAQ